MKSGRTAVDPGARTQILHAAIGFRVKSGWAATVLLAGSISSPRILDNRTIDLADPEVPASRQPYHEGMGVAQADAGRVSELVRLIERRTHMSVAEVVAEYQAAGHQIRGVGVVVGSEVDPERIANPHIRAHASEGRLFRTVVEEAARECGLQCTTMVERGLLERATEALSRPGVELKRVVAGLGRSVEGRWRVEEKAAALAAWVVLAGAEH